jgi:DNA replication and repair protein RecF
MSRHLGKALCDVQHREELAGTTLLGPHRDDLTFTIDGIDLRDFGSRGEHKSVLISLKIAEFYFLQQRREETPVMLMDDCYSELDGFREEKVFASLQNLGQVFMTSPREHQGDMSRQFPNSNVFHVENGRIETSP